LRTAREDEIRQRVIQITKQFGEEIQAIRAGASQLLVALGELDEVQKRDSKECGATFAKLKARFESYVRIGAADDAGNVFCSDGPVIEPSVAETEFFKRSITGDGLAVGNFFVDPNTGEKMMHFAERFYGANGKVAGVVFAGLDLKWLAEHLKERGLTSSQSILIADRLGNIIARLPNGDALVGKSMRKSHEEIMDGNTAGWEEAAGVDGVARIFGYVPVALPPKDFFLSAGQSKVEAMEPIEAATKRGILLILLGLLAAMYLAWLGGRRLIKRPIATLLEGTAEWRQGHHDTRGQRDARPALGRDIARDHQRHPRHLENRGRQDRTGAVPVRFARSRRRGDRDLRRRRVWQRAGADLHDPGAPADGAGRRCRTAAPDHDEP